jgi:hypothetical protein
MKRILFFFLCCACINALHAQYFRRVYNLPNDNPPTIRFETYNDGLVSRLNFSQNNPQNYSFVGVGTSDRVTTVPCPVDGASDTVLQQFRFIRTNTTGATIAANDGYIFQDMIVGGVSRNMNANGEAVCEVPSKTNNGGYVAVGRVFNSACDNQSPDRSDALYLNIGAPGKINRATRYAFQDFEATTAPTEDHFTDVIYSKRLRNTFYACGYVVSPGKTDYITVTALDSLGNIYWSRTIRFTKPNSNVVGHYLQARGIVEDSATGNLLVVGVLKGLRDLNVSNPFACMLNAGGAVLWANSYDFGQNLTNEFNDVIKTFDGDFMIGGTTNTNSAVAPNAGLFDMWMVKLTPAGGVLLSRAYQEYKGAAGGYLQSKCIKLVERMDTANKADYFLTGPAFDANSNQYVSVYKLRAGVPVNDWQYNASNYPRGYGLDYVANNLASPGLAVFASTTDAPAKAGAPNSLLLKTYFNGATCTDYCPNNPTTYMAVQFTIIRMTPDVREYIKPTPLLPITRLGYTKSICTEAKIACGNNSLMASATVAEDALQVSPQKPLMQVTPNPATGPVVISYNNLTAGNYTLQLVDFNGRVILSKNINVQTGAASVPLNINSMAAGLYMVKLTGNNKQLVQKLVKQ